MLEALNSMSTFDSETLYEGEGALEVPMLKSEESVASRIQFKISILAVIIQALLLSLMRLFLRRKDLPFSDSTYNDCDLTYDPNQRKKAVITAVETLRLDANTVVKCLHACRQHNTTITALIHTLIKITLAADLYPQANFCISWTAVDLRRYAAADDGLHSHGAITNASASLPSRTRLANWRKAGTPLHRESSKTEQYYIDCAQGWLLAHRYYEFLSQNVQHGKRILRDHKSINLIGPDDEHYVAQMVPAIGQQLKQAFLVSNLGAFDPASSASPWTISDVEFSAGATKGGIGTDVVFNMASVKGGDCVINLTYEKGVLDPDMVRKLIQGVKTRLEVMIK
ncbi:putative peroxidase family protein [Phaeomoniella chlamydospora]|uniref:Putative peroxidase family protein n=1 Tax=Phaeomoniella chlamydospora TaxID=158046 RepID=A0A0G2H2L8_PHACM|nr:putative peroxidase family protein [Phaeomoniella chlamydospora]